MSKLALTLVSRNRHPYILTKESCSDYRVRLDPTIQHGRYLYLAMQCHEFGDDVILSFGKSVDARWVPAPFIKNARANAFEHHIPKEPEATGEPDEKAAPAERHVFDLRTEDPQGHRAEFGVYVVED
ncbi:MAG: hypothetical protein HY075_01305 [Deltaproteobacteria bacterium]|nr:hypothetical protein [Deltaproteobacteria bacterium]